MTRDQYWMLLFLGVILLILSMVAQILMILAGVAAIAWAGYNLFIVGKSSPSKKRRRG